MEPAEWGTAAVLCDFGEARFGDEFHIDEIQPAVFRAPEVVLRLGWSYPADIWNAALLVSHSSRVPSLGLH